MSLAVRQLTRRFGAVTAVDGVDLTVEPGELRGFLGVNGAGKSTTMRIVAGVIGPDSGAVEWNGTPVGQDHRRRFGFMPEQRGLYPRMRVGDQLVYFARLHGVAAMEARRSAAHWAERLGVAEYLDRPLQQLSHGNQQRVQLAAALVHDPLLLLLDEPFSGLDPVGVAVLGELVGDLARQGVGVLFSSHQLDVVESLCQTVTIIDRGRVVESGRLSDLLGAMGVLYDVEVAGDRGAWAHGMPGVSVVGSSGDRVRVSLHPAVRPQLVLDHARGAGPVAYFAPYRPTLSELFLTAVAGLPGPHPAGATGRPVTAPVPVEVS